MKKNAKNLDLWLFLAAVLIVLIFAFLPPFTGLGESAMLLIGIFIATVMLWISVGISWPSLFCLLALAIIPELSMPSLMASSMGNSAFSFLIFTFCCSHALNQTPFTRRCAVWFLSTRLAKKGPWWFLTLYFLSVLLLGSCMSTTVIVLIYLTINEEIFALLKLQKGDRFAALITIGLIITASISGAMTPIAHVFPIMAMSIYQEITNSTISYLAYLIAGIPAGLFATAAMLLVFRFVLRPDTKAFRQLDTSVLRESIPRADRREKITAAAFFLVVALWVLPDLLMGVIPDVARYLKSFGTVMPPLLGAMLLCLVRVEGKPLLSLGEAAASVPWPSLFMAASALALGAAMTNPDIGLSAFVENLLGPITSHLNGFPLVLLLLVITAALTNIGSNMVTVTIVCTVGIPLTLCVPGISSAALTIALGMMATYAFATPPAMTTVVLGTGSGWTTTAQMARYGFLVLIPCIAAIAFIAYPLAALFS